MFYSMIFQNKLTSENPKNTCGELNSLVVKSFKLEGSNVYVDKLKV